ncbi:hypothetical protein CQA66_07695 [Helicobacter aurati]|uniref:Uncharacterized protein n=1 Tax=Helicobacter aurati TaxID=137778 RepID=A0A3D8J042_9HELI|nr:hypothetical protein [Helicobacter aurati]RDU70713.1 hypothetical protein CQA66_07695 [Helicobacter aurati]
MKKSSTQDSTQKTIDILHKFLPLQKISPSSKLQTFFNLLYSSSPPEFILRKQPEELLAKHQDYIDNIHEVYAIILAVNHNNLEIFLKLESFKHICQAFCDTIEQLANKHYGIYLQCLQASVLHSIDTKTTKQILKNMKILRENGIISFHDEKCIQAALSGDSIRKATENKGSTAATGTIQSFAQSNPNHTLFKEQLTAIAKAKKILHKVPWARTLTFLCDENFTKQILIIGGKKTGKSTLIATLLCNNANATHLQPLEALSPICYQYGKGYAKIEYFNTQEMQALNTASTIPTDETTQKIKHERIYEEIYQTQKIQQVKNITIYHDSDILKYVRLINTPSLIPQALRHLQIYECLIASQNICYLINTEELFSTNANKHYEYNARVIFRLLTQDNITCVYVIYSQIDKINLTLKKRQTLYNKLFTLIEQKLEGMYAKQELLKKLHFHYLTPGIAYNLRLKNLLSSESGFDMSSSGILELERQLFAHIFESPVQHISIEILKNILNLCKNDYQQNTKLLESCQNTQQTAGKENNTLQEQEENPASNSAEISSNSAIQQLLQKNKQAQLNEQTRKKIESILDEIKQNVQLMTEKLPAKYSSFYVSFSNLRDNLYSQFIQSINYEMRKRTGFSIKRLKNSTIDSIVIGLQSLSEILQNHFLTHKELHNIAKYLDSKNPNSLIHFALTQEHQNILNLLSTHFNTFIKDGYSTDSSHIIAEHLSYRLNLILPDNAKKGTISEEAIIKPIKAGFEYYFLLLERNIEELFNKHIAFFSQFMQQALCIIQCILIDYYQDAHISDKEEYSAILKNL